MDVPFEHFSTVRQFDSSMTTELFHVLCYVHEPILINYNYLWEILAVKILKFSRAGQVEGGVVPQGYITLQDKYG